MKKKLCILIVLCLIVSVFPMYSFANDEISTLEVNGENATPGKVRIYHIPYRSQALGEELTIQSYDGKQYKLKDFQEEYVALIYGRPACGISRGALDAAYNEFRKWDNLKIAFCCIDDYGMDPRSFEATIEEFAAKYPEIIVSDDYDINTRLKNMLLRECDIMTGYLPVFCLLNSDREIIFASGGNTWYRIEQYLGELRSGMTWDLNESGVLTVHCDGDMPNNYDLDPEIYGVRGDSVFAPWKNVSDSIREVVFDESVTGIGDYAFVRCPNLEKVTLPDGIQRIGTSAFEGCTSLKDLLIPDSVIKVGQRSIPYYCNVRYCGDEEQWKEIAPFHPGGFIHYSVAGFKDVFTGAYYDKAVEWAKESNIATGLTETTFASDSNVTRAEAMTFLWRAMNRPEPQNTNNPFTDVNSTDYYYKPILWAVENGITTGTSNSTYSPDQPCTYAQILTFIWRCCGEEGKTGTGEWYDDAIDWARENSLFGGEPIESLLNEECPRRDVITFLYRALT